MQNIHAHISELLRDYDCVIIPELGGFVANPVPARIDHNQGLFLPPARAIVFNQNLQNNDGLLVNKVAEAETIDYKTAISAVREYVLLAKTTLQKQGRFEMEHIGILYHDHEKNLCFTAEEELLALPEAYGLAPFYAKPLPVMAPPTEAAPVVTTAIKRTVKKPVDRPAAKQVRETDIKKETTKNHEVVVVETRKRRRWPLVVAASGLMIAAFYFYHIPNNTNYRYSGKFEFAQLIQFGKHENPTTYQPRETEYVCNPLVDSDPLAPFAEAGDAETIQLKFSEASDNLITVRLSAPAKKDNTELADVSTVRIGKRYQIIAGCFANKDNAIGQVNTLKEQGFDAVIFDHHKGLYRVSAAGFTDRKKAREALRQFRNNGSSAWLLKH